VCQVKVRVLTAAGSYGGVGKRGLSGASSSGHTITFLPSCHWNISVSRARFERVHLECSEDGMEVHLEDGVPDLFVVERSGTPDPFQQDLAGPVSPRGVIRETGAGELLPVGLRAPRIINAGAPPSRTFALC
jgi:hypothetical protein